MPLKTYRCANCQHEQEVLIRNEQDIPSVCPKCNHEDFNPSLSRIQVGKSSSSMSGGHQCAGGQCCGGQCHVG